MRHRITIRGHGTVKTAIVHDWLVTYAGAERALEQILSLYPEADLYSLVDFIPQGQRAFILDKKVKNVVPPVFSLCEEEIPELSSIHAPCYRTVRPFSV